MKNKDMIKMYGTSADAEPMYKRIKSEDCDYPDAELTNGIAFISVAITAYGDDTNAFISVVADIGVAREIWIRARDMYIKNREELWK